MVTNHKRNSSTSSNKRTSRKEPGASGQGDYYHVEVRSRGHFVKFRTQDVGDPGHIQRIAGQRETGSWGTVKWLIGKEDAHVAGNRLVGDTKDAKDVINKLGSKPVHKMGDIFEAKPRRNLPERVKATRTQKTVRSQNFKKAQTAKGKRKSPQ
jgi:hypothetical protein